MISNVSHHDFFHHDSYLLLLCLSCVFDSKSSDYDVIFFRLKFSLPIGSVRSGGFPSSGRCRHMPAYAMLQRMRKEKFFFEVVLGHAHSIALPAYAGICRSRWKAPNAATISNSYTSYINSDWRIHLCLITWVLWSHLFSLWNKWLLVLFWKNYLFTKFYNNF